MNIQEASYGMTGTIAFALMCVAVRGPEGREKLAHAAEVFRSKSALPVSARNELKDDVQDTPSMRRRWW